MTLTDNKFWDKKGETETPTPTTTPTPTPTTTPGSCPENCVCLDKETAYRKGLEKLCGGKETICGKTSEGEPMYCWQGYECPKSCACLTEREAESEGLKLCNDEEVICGESNGFLKFCFMEETGCPEDCECMTMEEADRLGYKLCNDQMVFCGEKDGQSMYCFEKPVVASPCPPDCECMTEEKAKRIFNCPERCSDVVCDYESTTLTTAPAPMYCYRETCDVTSPCPFGCRCMTEEEAGENGYNIRCSDEPCDEKGEKYCYRKVYQCPEGCTCLSKDEGYEKGLVFCTDAAGNLVRCGIIDAEHGIYKYCFRKPVEKCHYDEYRQICTGYCPDSTKCTMTTDYEICLEDCKKRFEECLDAQSEECRKVYEECLTLCKPRCECAGYVCPEGCRCLDDNEVKEYEEEGLDLERCADKPCGDGKYCYRVVKDCYFDYAKQECVGSCEEGVCHLNTIVRDPNTGEVVYAECSCKPMGVCGEGCECMAREEAYRVFRNPVLCSAQPCEREIAPFASTAAVSYINKYCFREGVVESCYYDREKQECMGGCEEGECKMFRDAYGNPYCRCVSKLKPVGDATVERVLPNNAQPLTCIPVKLIVKPKEGVTGLIITETYPAEFEYKWASVEPDKAEDNTLKWLLKDKNGLKEQEIEYKLCLPRDAMGDYYFKGIWETEDNAGEIVGDEVLKVVPLFTDWPPCPVTDQMLLSFVSQWSEGELSDLELLQVIEVWSKGC